MVVNIQDSDFLIMKLCVFRDVSEKPVAPTHKWNILQQRRQRVSTVSSTHIPFYLFSSKYIDVLQQASASQYRVHYFSTQIGQYSQLIAAS